MGILDILKTKEAEEDNGLYEAKNKDNILYKDYLKCSELGEEQAHLIVDEKNETVLAAVYGWIIFEAVIELQKDGKYKWTILMKNVSNEDVEPFKMIEVEEI